MPRHLTSPLFHYLFHHRPFPAGPLGLFAVLSGLLAPHILAPSTARAAETDTESAAAAAIRPTEVIRLFNGRNLDGFYTWLRDTKHEDPRHVFQVENGVIHISGNGYGGLITQRAYRDYHLVAEFKWGDKTWEPRKDRARDSGILLHCVGPDGNAPGGTWMASIECQIIEGGVGDFIVVGGNDADGKPIPVSLTCHVSRDRDGEWVWNPKGERKTFTGGRINWYGRDPDWKDVLGFRGPQDVDSPHGQWTRLDVTCDGGHIRIQVNGVLVNEGFDATPRAGKLLFQTEGAEIFFRRIELHPLAQP